MMFKKSQPVSDPEIRSDFVSAIADSVNMSVYQIDISQFGAELGGEEEQRIRRAMFEAANAAVFGVMNLLDGTGDFSERNGMPKLLFEDFETKRQILLTDESSGFLHDDVMGLTIRWMEENFEGSNN